LTVVVGRSFASAAHAAGPQRHTQSFAAHEQEPKKKRCAMQWTTLCERARLSGYCPSVVRSPCRYIPARRSCACRLARAWAPTSRRTAQQASAPEQSRQRARYTLAGSKNRGDSVGGSKVSASALHLRTVGVGACVGHREDARPRVVQPARAGASHRAAVGSPARLDTVTACSEVQSRYDCTGRTRWKFRPQTCLHI